MKAFLINPEKKEITEIDLKESEGYHGDHLCELIHCRLFTSVRIPSSIGDNIFVDDEGYFVHNVKYFRLAGCRTPLAGNGVVTGLREFDGETVEPTITLEKLKNIVYFEKG